MSTRCIEHYARSLTANNCAHYTLVAVLHWTETDAECHLIVLLSDSLTCIRFIHLFTKWASQNCLAGTQCSI